MKKVLLASTALILSAGFASAQGITIDGDGAAGFQWIDGDPETFEPKVELDINFNYAGTTDAGLEFGGALTFDEGGFDGIELFISGSFGTITMGELDPATDNLGLSDVGLFGVGVDDLGDALRNATLDGADISYEYNLDAITFIASGSLADDEDGYAVYVAYDQGLFNGAVGYARDANGTDEFVLEDLLGGNTALLAVNPNYTISVQAGVSSGPVSAEALYSDWTVEDGGAEVGVAGGTPGAPGAVFIDGATAYGLELGYDFGVASVNAGYTNFSAKGVDGSSNAYGVGFEYPLGGGLAVEGGIGIIDVQDGDSITAADLGVSMSF